jgi:predicted mannosyl-3-phosphoglycerate phosphatase (HAD superfamily)
MAALIEMVKDELAEAITQRPCRFTQDSQIVFVCGAATGKETARDRMLQYASRNMQKDIFFKAESVFPPQKDGTHISDLLTLENEMAYLSDRIIWRYLKQPKEKPSAPVEGIDRSFHIRNMKSAYPVTRSQRSGWGRESGVPAGR